MITSTYIHELLYLGKLYWVEIRPYSHGVMRMRFVLPLQIDQSESCIMTIRLYKVIKRLITRFVQYRPIRNKYLYMQCSVFSLQYRPVRIFLYIYTVFWLAVFSSTTSSKKIILKLFCWKGLNCLLKFEKWREKFI